MAVISGPVYGVITTGDAHTSGIMIVSWPPILDYMPHLNVCTPVPMGHVLVLIMYLPKSVYDPDTHGVVIHPRISTPLLKTMASHA